jgi:phosphatidate cytidylyltransferase
VRLAHSLSTALAFLLLAAAWLSLMQLLDAGFVFLLSVLVIVWLADIAAYFAGRQWGRRKLAPAISPGKTWAGVGGAVAAVLFAALLVARLAPQLQVFSTLLQQRLPSTAALATLAALVGLSIVGDLFESLLKRQANVKDSGRLLPGHGGVLDRVDAMIAVLPAAALIDLWLRG